MKKIIAIAMFIALNVQAEDVHVGTNDIFINHAIMPYGWTQATTSMLDLQVTNTMLCQPSTNYFVSPIEIIEIIKESGSLTNVIKTLAASGDICAVLGHSWEHDRPATVGVIRKVDTSMWTDGELYVGRDPGTLDWHPGTSHWPCRICKKQDSRTTGEWEEK